MLKSQAVAIFMEHNVRPYLAECVQNGQRVDTVRLDTEWAAYADGLCKSREITEHQYHIWATPNWPKNPMV